MDRDHCSDDAFRQFVQFLVHLGLGSQGLGSAVFDKPGLPSSTDFYRFCF
jgi:hypothetical protein